MTQTTARQPMPQQAPSDRINNFNEVPLGYSEETAVQEASRCLQCKNAPCISGCPVEINIPLFIKQIKEKKTRNAIQTIKAANSLPAVCGRVCPQEDQCEKNCVLSKKNNAIAIGRLERFAADFDRISNTEIPQSGTAIKNNLHVAVIGSGPAGLTAASELLKLGYEVTVFEALHKAGGVLAYGIPEFRLPKDIVNYEIDQLKKMGANIKLDTVIGTAETINDLLTNRFAAVFIATGAGVPQFLNIPGENLQGIYTANEYLTRINLMKAYLFPQYDTPIAKGDSIAVFGAGNVAIDAARTAKRLGSKNVFVIYRRSREEIPAREEEVTHAEEEGIIFKLLTGPVKFIGNDTGRLTGVECIKMKLGEPDDSGRKRPVPVENSGHTVPIDIAIIAIGTYPNPLVQQTTPGLTTNSKGYIQIDNQTMQTSKPGVFAGGDIVTGSATVIEAMGAGKKAAHSIDQYCKTKK